MTFSQKTSLYLGIIFLLFIVTGEGCKTKSDSNPDNVILIVVDALRADHLSCYDYKRKTTPHIDLLAQNSLICFNSFSQSTQTPTSMASLFTGTYPLVHKVFVPPNINNEYSVLPESLWLISEVMHKKNFYTSAVTACGWVSSDSNYDQGFDEFHVVKRGDPRIIGDAIQFIREKKNENFFLYIHLLDLHDYFWLNKEIKNHKFLKPSYELSPLMKEFHSKKPNEIYQYLSNPDKEIGLTQEDLDYLIDRYDSYLFHTDKLIGDLVNALQEEGIFEKTMVILTADHGEKFMEHGEMVHGGKTLYNEVVHVPLIFHSQQLFPETKTVQTLVEHADILPTLVDIYDAGEIKIGNLNQLQGQSLLKMENDKSVFIVSPNRSHMKVINGKWSLIYSREGEEIELYDLEKDPLEKKDLSEQYKDVREQMLEILREKIRESLDIGQVVDHEVKRIDNEVKETLKSLGYIK